MILSNNDLTIILAGVIVMIVVITLIINVWIICRSGCWVCKKAPDFELNLPLATITTDVPEILPNGRPYQHDVAPVQYAAVLPRSQRGNGQQNQPPAPADRKVDKAPWIDDYYPAGMTVIDDGEQSRDVDDVTLAKGNAQPTALAQQQVNAAEAAKNALYAAVLPRSQRSALTKPTRNEPLDEADETENMKTMTTTTTGLTGGTDAVTNANEEALNSGQVHSAAKRNKKLDKVSKTALKVSANPDTVPSYEGCYMNAADTNTTATTSPLQIHDAGPHCSTMPMLGNSHQTQVAEPFYAEAKEVNAAGLMIASLGRQRARPEQPDPRGPGARTMAVAAGTTTTTTTTTDAGNLYANYSDVRNDFTKIV